MPAQKPSVAKDVFAYLLTFAMLYVGVISFIALLWQIINVQFPDPVSFYYDSSYDAMRNSIASLIVVWPVFLVMSRYIGNDMAKHAEKADLWVRKWLTYLTIFVAAITVIVDLITLINSFLSGELTLRFSLKVLVVLLVSAGVFGYEFWELRREVKEGLHEKKLMAIGSIALLVISIAAGFYFVGSPMTARQIRLDNTRISDLQSLQYQVVNYWQTKKTVPNTQEDLKDPLIGNVIPFDPATAERYVYKKNSDLSFTLCAIFSRETPSWDTNTRGKSFPAPYPADSSGAQQNEDWHHGAGETCFTRTIDPSKYKPVQP
ncbi:hypothetical protein HYV73_01235 [Candidatus Uhrbacteria bacterium]|nr:hypothetical protein [Candidatus Uhrbacteria bacterium]